MSSALDEDTQRALAEGQDAARAMLRAAQKDLQKVFIVFLIGFLGMFYALRIYVWDFLKGVTEAEMRSEVGDSFEVIAQTPFDVILLQAKISLVVGVIVAIPIFIYFARDALRERGMWPQSPVPRWKIALLFLLATGLFVGGAAYGYAVFFPVMFSFLAGFGFDAGFNPSYSIVMWTEFIALLTLSFGLAAQMPLMITGLSYAEIVPYETFRDKWRHAVVAIFVFGALFSPPDPFTQIMWAVPLIVLYGASLYLAKIVVTAKRGSANISVPAVARRRWNALVGLLLGGLALSYVYYEYGGIDATNGLLARTGSDYRIAPPGWGLGTSPEVAIAIYGGIAGVAFLLFGLAYFVYAELDAKASPPERSAGDPAAIDMDSLDAAGVRAAPPEAFAELSEDEALSVASAAMEDDDHEKARAVLDRFDEAEELRERDAETGEDGPTSDDDATTAEVDAGDDLGSRTSRAGSTFLDELTDGETDEDDIGGYYTDIMFIIDSLRSRSFAIVATFMLTMAGTFTWFYLGGLGAARDNFLSRMPPGFASEDALTIITLHPVEALIFMVKFSVLIGLVATLPMIAYYAWPALRDRGFVRGHRRVIFLWTGMLVVGLFGGFALGYLYLAPTIISFLVADARAADMILTYRVNDFFWLIIFTTAGIGLLADIPVFMLLLNNAGVPYTSMRYRWREITVAMLTFAAVFTPADIITMFLVTIPLMFAYGVGLFVLFFVTFGGRRDLSPPAEILS
ncbi:twin-arginine translocase subunit TatC [Haloferacaceae archaeon DSL9]